MEREKTMRKTKKSVIHSILAYSQRHRTAFNTQAYLSKQFTKSVSRRKIFMYKIVPSFSQQRA